MRLRAAVFAVLIISLLSVSTASAETQRGLFVAPVREYIQVPAGQSAIRKLTLANLTDKPAEIALSVDQFTVENFTYDYKFTPSKRDWIKLETTKVELQPGKSKELSYSVTVPPGATPGGYYFTIFATKTVGEEAGRKVRVGEALYVTVDGELRLTSYIEKESIPLVTFGGDIPFSFDARSTGNTHFFMYVSGSLKGIATDLRGQEMTHLLLPNTVRTIKGTIPSPSFPGIYQVTYGYRVDDGQTITQTKYLAYLPLWFIAMVIGTVTIGVTLWRRRKE